MSVDKEPKAEEEEEPKKKAEKEEPKQNGSSTTTNGSSNVTKTTEKPKSMRPSTMSMTELLENINNSQCQKEYLSRSKESVEEFAHRTYKLVALRPNWKQRGSSTMISALIASNLLNSATADRYLEKKDSDSDTTLKTTLCDDLFGFVQDALKAPRQQLTTKEDSTILIAIVGVYLEALQNAQKEHRDNLLKDREMCCAGSNDFGHMAERVEQIAQDIGKDCMLGDAERETLDQCVDALVGLYTADADYAAEMISYYIFKDIHETKKITSVLFTEEWLNGSIVEQIIGLLQKNCMTPIREDLKPNQIPKAIQATATRYVHYYLEQLLERSTNHKSLEEPYFADNQAALDKMQADSQVALTFFQGLAEDKNKPLIEAELELLDNIRNILVIAAGLTDDDDELNDCILAVQARVQKYDTTYYIMGDLYHLVAPSDEKKAYDRTRSMARELRAMNKTADARVPGLSLEPMLMDHLIESRGQRRRLGAGVLNNMFGRLGKSLHGKPPAAPPDKLTYEEMEKELTQVRNELEQANERAQKAEEEAEDLKRELARAEERAKQAEDQVKKATKKTTEVDV